MALASRSHRDPETEAFLGAPSGRRPPSAGSSLKFCVVAQGEADVYPRFGPTMEWDTAAGDAVLRAAGGVVLQPDGSPFLYGKAESGLRNGAFVAWGDPQPPAALADVARLGIFRKARLETALTASILPGTVGSRVSSAVHGRRSEPGVEWRTGVDVAIDTKGLVGRRRARAAGFDGGAGARRHARELFPR